MCSWQEGIGGAKYKEDAKLKGKKAKWEVAFVAGECRLGEDVCCFEELGMYRVVVELSRVN